MQLLPDAPHRLVFRLAVRENEEALRASLSRLGLKLVARRIFDAESASLEARAEGFDAEVVFRQYQVPDLAVGGFSGPDRVDLAMHCLSHPAVRPAALMLRLALAGPEDVAGWRKNTRQAALLLLGLLLRYEEGQSYWSAAADRVVSENLRDPDLTVRRAALESGSSCAPSRVVLAVDKMLETETRSDVREEFAGYRAQLEAFVSTAPPALLGGSAVPRMAFPVIGSSAEEILADISHQAEVVRRYQVGGTMGASLRAELFDADIFYVGLADRTPGVGCLYFSGPEADKSAYFLAERVRYLPSELAKALVVESKVAASRVMALLALGLGEMHTAAPHAEPDIHARELIAGAVQDPDAAVAAAATFAAKLSANPGVQGELLQDILHRVFADDSSG